MDLLFIYYYYDITYNYIKMLYIKMLLLTIFYSGTFVFHGNYFACERKYLFDIFTHF